MGLFGTFVARKVGYMRSSLSNRDLNRLIIEKINELDKDEQNTLSAFQNKVHHSVPHQFHLQLNTMETITFYLNVKVVRLLEENKKMIDQMKTEIKQLEQEKRKFAQEGKYAFKNTDNDEIKQLKHVLFQKENDAIIRKITAVKEVLRKCEEFRTTLIKSANKTIQDTHVIRSNA